MTVDELLDKCQGDDKIWSLYWNGFTQCLNQCEKPASTQRCMQFRPQNVVELASFIAGIRPGFKSMLNTFITRTPFHYGIKSLDDLLKIEGMTGTSADSAFLLYDEQILKLLITGGMEGGKAYATIKAIKKKKVDKVLAAKEEFKTGFSKYLKETEGADEKSASDIVDKIWKIIEDSSNYLFCCAHSYAMACDSLYCAYLKAYYPFEFYTTALKLYTEKGKKDKIALLIDEMRRYYSITMQTGTFGQDNRDWAYDKENRTISQNLTAVKHITKSSTASLYRISTKRYNTFTDLLWEMLQNTSINSREIDILIKLGYFKFFGEENKLLAVAEEFRNGTSRLTKTVKSYEARLETMREFEKNLVVPPATASQKAAWEFEFTGMCLSSDKYERGTYIVTDVDDKYSIKIRLYNVSRGRQTEWLRMKKDVYGVMKPEAGEIIRLKQEDCKTMPKRIWANGTSTFSKTENETWITNFRRVKT